MDELEKLIEEFNAQLEEDKKKKKKQPFSSMTVTTGNPAHDIKMFNKRNGTDGMPNCDWNVDNTQKAAEEAAKDTNTTIAQNSTSENSTNLGGETPNSSGNATSGAEGTGEGASIGESLDKVEVEEIPTDFAGIMDYLSKDEEEAIEGYDKVLDNVEDEKVKDNLEHIRDEEVAHKEYLDAAKEDPTVDYEHAEDEEEKLEEEVKLAEDKVFAAKMGGYVELPPQIKLIPQKDVEDAIRKLDPEEAFTVGYVTPIYFYKKLLDKFTLIKCTQMIGYTGVDYRAANVADALAGNISSENSTARIQQAKDQIANPEGKTDYGVIYNKENNKVKSAVGGMRKEYADVNKTVVQSDQVIYERDPVTGKIVKDASKHPVIKDTVKDLKTILFYPMVGSKPKVKYFIDVKDGSGYREISREFLVDTIYNKVLEIIQRDFYNGTITRQEDMSDVEVTFLGDVRKKAEMVIANDEQTIESKTFKGGLGYQNTVNGKVEVGIKPDVRALYTNQLYYLAGEIFDISTGKVNLSLGTKLIESLNEAKRYVRRYYMRPQDIFCSNKAEILKALIDHENENCSIYTLNNLGDTKDVNKLTNDDIIYYYDDGILYDKNHIRIMDYDLAIKHEEDREKLNPETTSDKTFKDVYNDRMTELTDLSEEVITEKKDQYEDDPEFKELDRNIALANKENELKAVNAKGDSVPDIEKSKANIEISDNNRKVAVNHRKISDDEFEVSRKKSLAKMIDKRADNPPQSDENNVVADGTFNVKVPVDRKSDTEIKKLAEDKGLNEDAGLAGVAAVATLGVLIAIIVLTVKLAKDPEARDRVRVFFEKAWGKLKSLGKKSEELGRKISRKLTKQDEGGQELLSDEELDRIEPNNISTEDLAAEYAVVSEYEKLTGRK